MSLWGSKDQANNAPKNAVAGGLGVSANGEVLYANTTASAFVPDLSIGTFGVDAVEAGIVANSEGTLVTHAGWVLRKEGTGGRAGRVHYETLVAMGSMTGDGGVVNDDLVFPDTED